MDFSTTNYNTLTTSEKTMFSLRLRSWLTDVTLRECSCRDLRESLKMRNEMRRLVILIKKVETVDYISNLNL